LECDLGGETGEDGKLRGNAIGPQSLYSNESGHLAKTARRLEPKLTRRKKAGRKTTRVAL